MVKIAHVDLYSESLLNSRKKIKKFKINIGRFLVWFYYLKNNLLSVYEFSLASHFMNNTFQINDLCWLQLNKGIREWGGGE